MRVIDGDTIELEGGARVRYIGIDTPEPVGPNRPEGCFGPEASARNRVLVEGKTVSLETDLSETDRFGRLLRYVWLREVLVNEALVAGGYAQVATFPPDVKYEERFLAAQREAREQGRGLWSACASSIATPTGPPAGPQPARPTGSALTFVKVAGGPPGSRASVTVQTAPRANCTIRYVTPSGTASQAQGLTTKAADGNGQASWSWVIGSSTRPGTGTVTVTCGSMSASSSIRIG